MKSRGSKGLAHRYRPQLLSEVFGQSELIQTLRTKWESLQRPTAYLFSGPTGVGKTTVARIISVSANCTHQPVFGEPCLSCRRTSNQFDIVEINASDVTTVDKLKNAVAAYDCVPVPPSRFRIYILDEAQRMSEASQNFLLKPFEDGPASTIWMICTTNPRKILEPLQGRCLQLSVLVLGTKGTEAYVQEIIESERSQGFLQEQISKQNQALFAENLVKQGIRTPRNILTQLEKFLVSGDPNVVFNLDLEGDVRIGNLVYHGEWVKVRVLVASLTESELLTLRYALIGYFKTILLTKMPGPEADKLAKSIEDLAQAGAYEDSVTASKVVAALYNICKRFGVGGMG